MMICWASGDEVAIDVNVPSANARRRAAGCLVVQTVIALAQLVLAPAIAHAQLEPERTGSRVVPRTLAFELRDQDGVVVRRGSARNASSTQYAISVIELDRLEKK
jgi:hypothetical protein